MVVSEWDMHTPCDKVCEVCNDRCDSIAGHGGECHWQKHAVFEQSQEFKDRCQGNKCDWCQIPGRVHTYEEGTFCGIDCRNAWANEANDRPGWPETWMSVASSIAKRSYDPRLQVGAIIVTSDNTQMLAVGYNGNHKGGPHRHESDEPGQSGFLHAEANALVKCDYNNPKEKHMYLTHSPCRICAKLIINANIKRVVYLEKYRDLSSLGLLASAGVEVYSLSSAILMAEDEDATRG